MRADDELHQRAEAPNGWRSKNMQTRYGRKSKPPFKIVGWKAADGKLREVRQLTPQTPAEEMSDELPW